MELEGDKSSRSDLATACSEGNYERAKELLAVGADPVTSRAGYFSWSPLHYTARQGKLDFAQTLISQYGCHPQVEDKEGRTPLHVACQYGQLEFARYLIQQKRCDATYGDIEDQTPLHHTCGWLSECTEQDALEISKYLINRGKCDPNSRDANGKSSVLHACEKGFLSVLKYFIQERNCDISVMDYKGNNALHLAVSFSSNYDVVSYIIGNDMVPVDAVNSRENNVLHIAAISNSSLDVCGLILSHSKATSLIETKNENGLTPLDLASEELLRFTLTRFQIHSTKFYEKYATTLGVKQSLASKLRVFVLGDTDSGKTTLINSLQRESTSSFSLSFSSSSSSSQSPVSQLTHENRGITVCDFESRVYGGVSFYDFSGHSDYQYIQEAVLKVCIRPQFSVFVVMVDLHKPARDVHLSLLRWLSLLSRSWSGRNCEKLRVIIVGSRADVVKSSSKSQRGGLKSIAVDTLEASFRSVEIVAKVQVDSHRSDHSGVSMLRKQLSTVCNKMEGGESLSFNACCLLAYLKSGFDSLLAVSLHTLVANIKTYKLETSKQIHDLRYFLSDDTAILIRLLSSLDRAGHIGLITNEEDTEKSLILIQASEHFSDCTKLWSTNTTRFLNEQNLVPISRLGTVFPDVDVDSVVQIFLHLKLCVQIDLNTEGPFTDQSKQLYFPSLLSQSAPQNVWDPKCIYSYHKGWFVEKADDDLIQKSFSPRLFQAVLLDFLSSTFSQSAFKFEAVSLWKNGIYLRSTTGGIFEMLIEAFEDLHSFYVLIRAQRFTPSFLRYCSAISRLIRESVGSCVESFMDPFHAMHYPLLPRELLTLFPVSEITRSIHAMNTFTRTKDGVAIPLDKVIHFEPFQSIGNECLRVLSEVGLGEPISDQFLRSMAGAIVNTSDKVCFFASIFSCDQSEFAVSDNAYSKLLSWRNVGDKSYDNLVQLFAGFTMFRAQDLLSNLHLNL